MRKILSIFLLSCFCLYYFGYIFYFFAFQHQLNRVWDQHIWEETYDVSSTEMIEIPLSIPYMANQEDFQTTNLSMEIEGQFLRVVKQRYQNDTLQIVYLKDHQKQKLDEQVSDWIKSITDNSQNSSQERSLIFAKILPKDFMANEIASLAFLEIRLVAFKNIFSQNPYSDIFISLNSPPPQVG